MARTQTPPYLTRQKQRSLHEERSIKEDSVQCLSLTLPIHITNSLFPVQSSAPQPATRKLFSDQVLFKVIDPYNFQHHLSSEEQNQALDDAKLEFRLRYRRCLQVRCSYTMVVLKRTCLPFRFFSHPHCISWRGV